MNDRITCPKPGIYRGVPFSEYLRWDAFSKSLVLPMLRSPAHMMAKIEHPDESSQLTNGSLVDTLLFEPSTFDSRYVVQPDTYGSLDTLPAENKPWNNNAKVCKDWNAAQQAAGLTIVKQADIDKAMIQVNAVKSHKAASQLLQRGEAQVSLVWQDEETGIICKARPDWAVEHKVIVDLKTTKDGSSQKFPYAMHEHGYAIQAWMYLEGWEAIQGEWLQFGIIAVENEYPYKVAAYAVEPEAIDVGERMARRAMVKYAECLESGEWPGYSQCIEPITLPYWVLKQELGDEVRHDTTGI